MSFFFIFLSLKFYCETYILHFPITVVFRDKIWKNSFKNMLFPKRVLYQLIVCTRTHLREGFIMEVRKQRWRVSSPNHVVPLNQVKVIWIGNKCPFSLRCVISHVLTSICAFIFPFFFSLTRSLYACERQTRYKWRSIPLSIIAPLTIYWLPIPKREEAST